MPIEIPDNSLSKSSEDDQLNQNADETLAAYKETAEDSFEGDGLLEKGGDNIIDIQQDIKTQPTQSSTKMRNTLLFSAALIADLFLIFGTPELVLQYPPKDKDGKVNEGGEIAALAVTMGVGLILFAALALIVASKATLRGIELSQEEESISTPTGSGSSWLNYFSSSRQKGAETVATVRSVEIKTAVSDSQHSSDTVDSEVKHQTLVA